MKKWLIIQFKQIGDVVLTTHLPREIKKIFPDAKIDFLTFSITKDLLKHNPNIRKVYTANKKDSALQTIKNIFAIRKEKYDVILDTQDTPRSLQYALFSGAKRKICYDKSRRNKFYTDIVPSSAVYAGMIKLKMLTPFTDADTDTLDCRPEIFLSDGEILTMIAKTAEIGLDLSRPYTTISPTHKWANRRWKIEHYLDTANWIAGEHGMQVILTHGPGELEYIQKGIESYGKPLNDNIFIAPALSMLEFTALISKASLHIGNDSSPHHIAVSQKIPTFIIIGSTSKGWMHPAPMHTYINLGMECQPCRKTSCEISEDVPCMQDLTFDKIKDTLNSFIKEHVLK